MNHPACSAHRQCQAGEKSMFSGAGIDAARANSRSQRRADFEKQFVVMVGLAEKKTFLRQILFRQPFLAGYDYDFDGWPATVHDMGKFRSVHAAVHDDICDHHGNVRAAFQDQ